MTTSNLQKLVGAKLINDMLRCESVRQKERNDWKVLVMDRLATRIISASCKMHDIMSEGITIVEDLNKGREPLITLEAVYFIQPNESSINELINDFDKVNALKPKYKAAHVFFTEACNTELFNRLTQSKCAKYIKTLREVNVAFLPYERQVFTLDSPDTLFLAYHPSKSHERAAHLEFIAEQIATLCSTLGEYPTIRYRSENEKMPELAQFVQQKLNQYKADDSSMGEGGDKAKSVLLLLDRGFDPVSPLLHELTFQAMAYDLLKIENDVFINKSQASETADSTTTQEFLLDESDDLWVELRHQHIAVVTGVITKKIKDFAVEKRVKDADRNERTTLRDLSLMLKKMPQYQKELKAYLTHFNMAEQCMNVYKIESGDKLCSVEQSLAMGEDADGEKIRDPMKNIVPLLLDTIIAVDDKLRIILLYILYKNGITDENLDKLLSHASIPSDKRNVISNLQHLNLQIIQDQNRSGRKKNIPHPRKERNATTYTNSRWTPYVKDIMEDIIDEKLDLRQFPISGGQRTFEGNSAAQSSREKFGGWMQNRRGGASVRTGPRLIVFILGGASYNELRTAYEVTQNNNKRWEVFIGSDHIITPKQFLDDLQMQPRSERK